MHPIETLEVAGNVVTVRRQAFPVERYTFSSPVIARKRAAFVTEGISWIGTPFVDCADVKGRAGAVDCAMMLTRCAVDTGLTERFDPRPYKREHMLHSSEELFLGWVRDKLGASETKNPTLGDVAVYMFGRCFCHGGIIANSKEIVHAYAADRMCTITAMNAPLLTTIPVGSVKIPRPVLYFDLCGV